MQLSDFGSWGSRAFAFGPQLSLPLFNGGRLQGMVDLREAQQQEAALAYQQTVLRAWHEIDDQLSRYNASQLRRDSLAEAVRQNQIALRGEVVFGWCIMDTDAFSVIVGAGGS